MGGNNIRFENYRKLSLNYPYSPSCLDHWKMAVFEKLIAKHKDLS